MQPLAARRQFWELPLPAPGAPTLVPCLTAKGSPLDFGCISTATKGAVGRFKVKS